jgi:hypothetical protein
MIGVARSRWAVSLAALTVLAGCFLRREPAVIEPAERSESPVTLVAAPPVSAGPVLADPIEPRVDLEMVNAPVKLVLQKLADIGGLELIIPPNLNRTLSVQYVRVPVSVALADVLARAGLRLGPAALPNMPFDTVTVFYRLPANVDSMSADAIVRRFGVSRGLAKLLVDSRRP